MEKGTKDTDFIFVLSGKNAVLAISFHLSPSQEYSGYPQFCRHKKEKHSGKKKQWSCSECPYACHQRSDMNRHLKRVHGLPPYPPAEKKNSPKGKGKKGKDLKVKGQKGKAAKEARGSDEEKSEEEKKRTRSSDKGSNKKR